MHDTLNLEKLLHLPVDVFRLVCSSGQKKLAHRSSSCSPILCDGLRRPRPRTEVSPVFPDGVLLAAPDQGVVLASPESPLSDGLTFLIVKGTTLTKQRLNQLIAGLEKLGRNPPSPSQSLREFTIDRIEDLEWCCHPIRRASNATIAYKADSTIRRDQRLPYDTPAFHDAVALLSAQSRTTRWHGFFDEFYFPAGTFLRRLLRRLSELGGPFGLNENSFLWST